MMQKRLKAAEPMDLRGTDYGKQETCVIEKTLQEKIQKNPYFTLNYKENKGFPGFPGVFSYECVFPSGCCCRIPNNTGWEDP